MVGLWRVKALFRLGLNIINRAKKRIVFACLILFILFNLPLLNYWYYEFGVCSARCSVLELSNKAWMYHNRSVRVTGFLSLDFEDTTLYPSKEYEQYHLGRGIWINDIRTFTSSRNELNKRYVLIEGTFSSMYHGHDTLAAGSIQRVTKVDFLD
jgi:hypothetical protein